MKKSNKRVNHLVSQIKSQSKRQIHKSKREKHKKYLRSIKNRGLTKFFSYKENRNQFRNRFYNKRYKGPKESISIDGEFGLEEEKNVDYFLNKASEFIDFESKELIFDLKQCSYMWPSAITLLCSLAEWVELSWKGRKPIIRSYQPNSEKVSSYLNESGFYEYVERSKDKDIRNYYNSSDIVKIRRELDSSEQEQREDEIIGLLRSCSDFSERDLELFNDVILTEIFNNVVEHGISHRDKGYFLIAQKHSTHKFISICIADNGIGIRNTLMTGPQKESISKQLDDVSKNDGLFIKLAVEKEVSGSLNAAVPQESLLRTRFSSGANRGNGLKRILERCIELHINLTILSQFGYIMIDDTGKIIKNGALNKRIFAGTLFHLLIKGK